MFGVLAFPKAIWKSPPPGGGQDSGKNVKAGKWNNSEWRDFTAEKKRQKEKPEQRIVALVCSTWSLQQKLNIEMFKGIETPCKEKL